MSVNPVSGTPPPPPVASAAPLAKQTAPTGQPQHDTVKLSGTALAKSLKLAGQTPAQIAQKMGLDIKVIDSYLSIKQVATAAPPPTPAAPEANQAPAPTPQKNAAPEAKPAATDTAATPQPNSPSEEVAEPAAQKASETLQGKK